MKNNWDIIDVTVSGIIRDEPQTIPTPKQMTSQKCVGWKGAFMALGTNC
jgi:hypothetical protein